MSTKDTILQILAGGIPSLVDGESNQSATVQKNNVGEIRTVEQTPPEPQLADKEAFRVAGNSVSQGQLGTFAMYALGGLVIFLVAREL